MPHRSANKRILDLNCTKLRHVPAALRDEGNVDLAAAPRHDRVCALTVQDLISLIFDDSMFTSAMKEFEVCV